jgi:hypothetical protein
LKGNESKLVCFDLKPEPGSYQLRVGNSDLVALKVLKWKELNLQVETLNTYISPKANPAEVQVLQQKNAFTIKASGWDFYHAEDAYATENLPENTPTPIWVRLERHGNRFTGSVSLDGQTWIVRRQTDPIPGVAPAVDLGLAAGAPDQKQYTVEFQDWKIRVEDE